jgi:hypothetical protein
LKTTLTDPWVDDDVEDVRDQVRNDEHGREDQRDRLHHGVVLVLDRRDQLGAEPVQAERELDDHGAGDQVADRETAHRHDRNERTPERMADDDGRPAEPPAPSRLDVLQFERVDHARARDATNERTQGQRERDCRQCEVVDATGEPAPQPEDGEPVKVGGEHDDQHDRRDVLRERRADEHDPRDHDVGRLASPHRSNDAAAHAEQQHEDPGVGGELEGRQDLRPDHIRDRSLACDRRSEVPVKHIAEPVCELDEKRSVEVVVRAQRGDLRRENRVPAREDGHRVTRREIEERVEDERHHHEQRRAAYEPPE